MENENKDVEVDDIPDLPQIEDGEEDSTDYKAEALKFQGIAKRYKTKLEKSKKVEVKSEAKSETKEELKPKSNELDYGQKAYLASQGYKSPKEMEMAHTIMKETGKTLDQVLESKYFKAEVEEMRELDKSQKASDATGKSKRSASSPSNEVEYWIAKGELPTDRELRKKVIDARRKKDSRGNPFR